MADRTFATFGLTTDRTSATYGLTGAGKFEIDGGIDYLVAEGVDFAERRRQLTRRQLNEQ